MTATRVSNRFYVSAHNLEQILERARSYKMFFEVPSVSAIRIILNASLHLAVCGSSAGVTQDYFFFHLPSGRCLFVSISRRSIVPFSVDRGVDFLVTPDTVSIAGHDLREKKSDRVTSSTFELISQPSQRLEVEVVMPGYTRTS